MVGNYNLDLNKRLNAFYLYKVLLYKYCLLYTSDAADE